MIEFGALERGERSIRRDVLARQHGLSDRQALALGRVLDGSCEHPEFLEASDAKAASEMC